MDAIANLREQLALAKEIRETYDTCPEDGAPTADQMDSMYQNAERLAELVEALYQWRVMGGADPFWKVTT